MPRASDRAASQPGCQVQIQRRALHPHLVDGVVAASPGARLLGVGGAGPATRQRVDLTDSSAASAAATHSLRRQRAVCQHRCTAAVKAR